MSYIWNSWVGYTKPMMDFRDDGPAPSPPDNPPADECFWHSCAPVPEESVPSIFDQTIHVTPPELDSTTEVLATVEAAGFDAIN